MIIFPSLFAKAWAASAALVLFELLAHISGLIFDAFKLRDARTYGWW